MPTRRAFSAAIETAGNGHKEAQEDTKMENLFVLFRAFSWPSLEAGGDYDVVEVLRELEEEMQEAASKLELEKAALLRDQIMELKKGAASDTEASAMNSKPVRATYSRPKRTRKASGNTNR